MSAASSAAGGAGYSYFFIACLSPPPFRAVRHRLPLHWPAVCVVSIFCIYFLPLILYLDVFYNIMPVCKRIILSILFYVSVQKFRAPLRCLRSKAPDFLLFCLNLPRAAGSLFREPRRLAVLLDKLIESVYVFVQKFLLRAWPQPVPGMERSFLRACRVVLLDGLIDCFLSFCPEVSFSGGAGHTSAGFYVSVRSSISAGAGSLSFCPYLPLLGVLCFSPCFCTFLSRSFRRCVHVFLSPRLPARGKNTGAAWAPVFLNK